jgi:hypothetical protein
MPLKPVITSRLPAGVCHEQPRAWTFCFDRGALHVGAKHGSSKEATEATRLDNLSLDELRRN